MILKDAATGQDVWINPKMIQCILPATGSYKIVFEGGFEVVVESKSLDELTNYLGLASTLARIVPTMDGFVVIRDVKPTYLTSHGWDVQAEVFPTKEEAERVKRTFCK